MTRPEGEALADAYREDLAFIHDAGFGGLARGAASVLREALAGPGLVVDLGCGSGLLAEALASDGHEILGIDQSPALIAIARRRVPSGRFLVGSLHDADLPPCAAVACIGECVNYLFDPRASIRSSGRLFRRVFEALLPGGLFLFDSAGPGRAPAAGR